MSNETPRCRGGSRTHKPQCILGIVPYVTTRQTIYHIPWSNMRNYIALPLRTQYTIGCLNYSYVLLLSILRLAIQSCGHRVIVMM